MRMATKKRPATECPCGVGSIPPLGSVDSGRRLLAPRCPASVVAIIWHCHLAIGATVPSESDAGVLRMFRHIASVVAFALAATGFAQLGCAKTESSADVQQKILGMQPRKTDFASTIMPPAVRCGDSDSLSVVDRCGGSVTPGPRRLCGLPRSQWAVRSVRIDRRCNSDSGINPPSHSRRIDPIFVHHSQETGKRLSRLAGSAAEGISRLQVLSLDS
jgi:hypothetical protein